MAVKIEIEHEGDAYIWLANIQGIADSMTNILDAYELPDYIESQIRGYSASIITLAKMAERYLMEAEKSKYSDFEAFELWLQDVAADEPDMNPDTILNMTNQQRAADLPSPRMADEIDRVDVSKMSVTELHAILTALDDVLNRAGTSQTFSDFFMRHYEDVQDAFFNCTAKTPTESLLKITTLSRDDIQGGSIWGDSILEEAQQFMGVSV